MKNLLNKISMYEYALEILENLNKACSIEDDSFEGVIIQEKGKQHKHIFIGMKNVEILSLNSDKEFEVKYNFDRKTKTIEIINAYKLI